MRGIVATGLVIAVTALAGCTEDPEPRFDDPTESPSATESTTSAAAEPEPWEEQSKAGAVAFAKHWVDVFNEAQSSGDTAALKEVSTPQCVSCADLVDQVDAIYADGGSLESSGWRVVRAASAPGPVGETPEVVLRIDRSPQVITDGNGKVSRFPGGQATFSLGLRWVTDAWAANELVRL